MTPLDISLHFGAEEGRAVGRLAERERRIFFEFDPSFLASPLPISPFHLEPRSGVIEGSREPFEGLHGAFADSLPDAWGRLLIDRALRREGRNPAMLTSLDTLAMVGKGGVGALSYHPAREQAAETDAVDIERLADDAAEVLADTIEPVALERLRALGGSSGGARPKALLHLDPQTSALFGTGAAGREPWIVKFRGGSDPVDSGAVEFTYAELARRAGLTVSPTRLFPMPRSAGCFGTQRFDRYFIDGVWTGRRHMHSLAGLLQAEYRIPSVGYDSLIKATRLLTKSEPDAEAAFRLAVFNIAVHNRDDHAKNVAFLMDAAGEWQLAPAFDLTFSEGPGGEHSMDVMGEGLAPAREHVLALAKSTSIRAKHAARIIAEVCAALGNPAPALLEAGTTKRTAAKLADIIAGQVKALLS